MEKKNFKGLLDKVKAKDSNKIILEVVPEEESKRKGIKDSERQFSFHIEKVLLKKIKLKAMDEDMSLKHLMHDALRKYLGI